MSTRSTTHFIEGDRDVAIIYRHSDGYPEGHGVDLGRFFDDVEAQTKDTRFGDPSYLAAKLVVWLAREFAKDFVRGENGYEYVSHADERPLDFLSVGIVQEDPGDVEYVYTVDCNHIRPVVRCYETTYAEGDKVIKGREVTIPEPETVDA